MKKTGILIFLAFFGCSQKKESVSEEIVFDVKKVLNKTQDEVVGIMGPPDSTYVIQIINKKIPAQMYFNYNIEIQYPKGKASDIVVYEPHNMPFEISTLEKFNVKIKKAPKDFVEKQLMRWYDVDGLGTVAMYNPKTDSLGNLKKFTIFFKAQEN